MYAAKMADIQSKEEEIFRDYYSKLINTMVDIDNLLLHFVSRGIIHVDDLEKISAKPRTADRVEKLLLHISGSLKAGNMESFYIMLSIMKDHGAQATRELASTMMRSLVTADECILTVVT